jgi:NADH-quinone oxidoreductase subunit G
LVAAVDDGLLDDVIRAAAAHPLTRGLGDMVAAVEVLKG